MAASDAVAAKTNVNNDIECVICMDDEFKMVDKLECGHEFHKKCIELWGKQNKTCPICRERIVIIKQIDNTSIDDKKTIDALKETIKCDILRYSVQMERCVNNVIPHKNFTCSSCLIQTIYILYTKLDNIIQKEPDDIELVYNCWNNHKSEWYGDYFVAPLLSQTIRKYIKESVPRNNGTFIVKFKKLYFCVLKSIIDKNIILDESYTKSNKLCQFFKALGTYTQSKWIGDSFNFKNKSMMSTYTRSWIAGIYSNILNQYNKEINVHPVMSRPNMYNSNMLNVAAHNSWSQYVINRRQRRPQSYISYNNQSLPYNDNANNAYQVIPNLTMSNAAYNSPLQNPVNQPLLNLTMVNAQRIRDPDNENGSGHSNRRDYRSVGTADMGHISSMGNLI